MNVYYKYSKYYGINSLKDLKLRISSPFTLNDPFEEIMNENVTQRLKTIAEPSHVGLNYIHRYFGESITNGFVENKIDNLITEYGVVSFSETPRNLLMWAHYADEHHGLCIGFKEDLFEIKPNKIKTHFNVESYTPIKVSYDSARPQNIDEELDTQAELWTQARRQLLTKSDDWIYEKEYRCILPIRWADQLKIISNEEDTFFEQDFINDGTIDEVDDNTYEGIGVSVLADMLFKNKSKAFLKKINISSVASIYLGCKFDVFQMELLIDLFNKEDSPFKNIKLYKCRPSKNRFELEIEQLYPLSNGVR
ncbi:DUF2971 domain-containing protein [Aeromonas dhakensis]|uniref:DUF2971 domain-containing protein n=1 Tax=Aeromonas dhakensis TaxID=196024 RepID=UPI002B4A24B9|nr:DUF2971 domain-containing protein [Aeromonas dhakensis]